MKTIGTIALALTLAFGGPSAYAQAAMCDESTLEDVAGSIASSAASQRTDQILYKGVVGNLLEAMPLEPAQRVDLQRTNAVISSPISARSLALLLGISNPIVMIGGLVWGIWSASRIEAPAAKAPEEPVRVQVASEAAAGE